MCLSQFVSNVVASRMLKGTRLEEVHMKTFGLNFATLSHMVNIQTDLIQRFFDAREVFGSIKNL